MLQKISKYYRVGLISLVFLPVLSAIYLQRYLQPTKIFALQLNTPAQNSKTEHQFPPLRNYQKIELTGNQVNDDKEIRQVEVLIKNIINHNDSLGGVCVHLGNKVRYQSFITIVDISNVEKAKIFGLAGDNFWIAPILCNQHEEMAPFVGRCGTNNKLR